MPDLSEGLRYIKKSIRTEELSLGGGVNYVHYAVNLLNWWRGAAETQLVIWKDVLPIQNRLDTGEDEGLENFG